MRRSTCPLSVPWGPKRCDLSTGKVRPLAPIVAFVLSPEDKHLSAKQFELPLPRELPGCRLEVGYGA